VTWRALIIGDVHWRATNPVARRDNLKEALTMKLLECWDLAREHCVNAIIQTGDLFDSPTIVYSTLADLINLLQRAPAPIYTVAGNHDLFGATPESLYRTPLGFLFQLGIVRNAENGFDDGMVAITGRGYDADIDSDVTTYAIPPKLRMMPANIRVHITHGMLVDRPMPSRHTLISDLAGLGDKPDMPHVLINGHYHLGTGIHRVGRTLVVNPGALCRLSAAIEEIERPVQVALLETDLEHYDVQLITLQSARPGAEVLSRDHLIAQAEAERRREQFLELLASEQTAKVLDLADMIRDISARENLPDRVRDEALARIARAQEAIAA